MGIGRKSKQKKTIKPRTRARGEDILHKKELDRLSGSEPRKQGGLTNPFKSARERKAARKKGKK